MYKDTRHHDNERQIANNKPGYYELALYFAAAKAKEEEFHWEDFIDNLSFICDKYASHIKSNAVSKVEV